jgi:hypothetical protein
VFIDYFVCRRLTAQTSVVLNDHKWSKAWDAVITYFYYMQQRKQPSNFQVYRCNFTSPKVQVLHIKKLQNYFF